MNAELCEYLMMASVPIVERHRGSDGLEVKIVAGPLDGRQRVGEPWGNERFAGLYRSLGASAVRTT